MSSRSFISGLVAIIGLTFGTHSIGIAAGRYAPPPTNISRPSASPLRQPDAKQVKIYAPQQGLGTVDVYDAKTGAHLQSIADPNACGPYGAAADSHGNIWVTEACGNVINEYAPSASGSVSPINSITAGKKNDICGPLGVFVGAKDHVYVTNSCSQSVDVFAADATGPAKPISSISGALSMLDTPAGITVDKDGNVYVSNANGASVAVFAAPQKGSNDVAPTRFIEGSNTTFDSPYGVALDGAGDLFVGNYGAADALQFAPGATGNASPAFFYDGPLLLGVAVDGSDLYASGVDASNPSGNFGIIEVFKIGSSRPRGVITTGVPGDSSGANLITVR